MSAQKSPVASIDSLAEAPYIKVLCYPTSDKTDAERRVGELEGLGVDSVAFEGRTEISGIRILGKGCVSLVVKASAGGALYALKIRRLDADRISMAHEAEMTRIANEVGVGPSLQRESVNFLLMSWIQGTDILDWVKGLKGKGSTARLRLCLKGILDQCHALDCRGLDHGELSNLRKHVIVGEEPVIIDFESASSSRRPANVTSALQYLFIGGPLAKKVKRMLRVADTSVILDAVRAYKQARSEESYQRLLASVNLLSR